MSPAAANLGSVSAASANDTTSGSGVRPETFAREMINAALARCWSSAFASWNSCSLGTPRSPCRRSSFTTRVSRAVTFHPFWLALPTAALGPSGSLAKDQHPASQSTSSLAPSARLFEGRDAPLQFDAFEHPLLLRQRACNGRAFIRRQRAIRDGLKHRR